MRTISYLLKQNGFIGPTQALSTWGDKNTNFAYVAQFTGHPVIEIKKDHRTIYQIDRELFTRFSDTAYNSLKRFL